MDIKPVILNPRSKNITEGKSRAPNRSMYYAMGYEGDDFKKPMVGVANGHSTITPCNSGLLQWPASKRQAAMRRFLAHPPFLTAWPWEPKE
jgi:dihydroxyacid dehydratase/phosphogluconate dehydratase